MNTVKDELTFMRNKKRVAMTHKLVCAMLSNPANMGINPDVLVHAAAGITDQIFDVVLTKDQATKVRPAADLQPGIQLDKGDKKNAGHS